MRLKICTILDQIGSRRQRISLNNNKSNSISLDSPTGQKGAFLNSLPALENPRAQPRGASMVIGVVYFVTYEDALIRELHPYLKIGMTTRPIIERVKELSTGSPLKLVCVGHIPSDDYIRLELAFHHHFKKHIAQGEWIKVSQDIIDYINNNFELQDNLLEASFFRGIHFGESTERLKQENAELKTALRKKQKEIVVLRSQLGQLKRADWKTWSKSKIE
jgi:hypothetical protein